MFSQACVILFMAEGEEEWRIQDIAEEDSPFSEVEAPSYYFGQFPSPKNLQEIEIIWTQKLRPWSPFGSTNVDPYSMMYHDREGGGLPSPSGQKDQAGRTYKKWLVRKKDPLPQYPQLGRGVSVLRFLIGWATDLL